MSLIRDPSDTDLQDNAHSGVDGIKSSRAEDESIYRLLSRRTDSEKVDKPTKPTITISSEQRGQSFHGEDDYYSVSPRKPSSDYVPSPTSSFADFPKDFMPSSSTEYRSSSRSLPGREPSELDFMQHEGSEAFSRNQQREMAQRLDGLYNEQIGLKGQFDQASKNIIASHEQYGQLTDTYERWYAAMSSNYPGWKGSKLDLEGELRSTSESQKYLSNWYQETSRLFPKTENGHQSGQAEQLRAQLDELHQGYQQWIEKEDQAIQAHKQWAAGSKQWIDKQKHLDNDMGRHDTQWRGRLDEFDPDDIDLTSAKYEQFITYYQEWYDQSRPEHIKDTDKPATSKPLYDKNSKWDEQYQQLKTAYEQMHDQNRAIDKQYQQRYTENTQWYAQYQQWDKTMRQHYPDWKTPQLASPKEFASLKEFHDQLKDWRAETQTQFADLKRTRMYDKQKPPSAKDLQLETKFNALYYAQEKREIADIQLDTQFDQRFDKHVQLHAHYEQWHKDTMLVKDPRWDSPSLKHPAEFKKPQQMHDHYERWHKMMDVEVERIQLYDEHVLLDKRYDDLLEKRNQLDQEHAMLHTQYKSLDESRRNDLSRQQDQLYKGAEAWYKQYAEWRNKLISRRMTTSEALKNSWDQGGFFFDLKENMQSGNFRLKRDSMVEAPHLQSPKNFDNYQQWDEHYQQWDQKYQKWHDGLSTEQRDQLPQDTWRTQYTGWRDAMDGKNSGQWQEIMHSKDPETQISRLRSPKEFRNYQEWVQHYQQWRREIGFKQKNQLYQEHNAWREQYEQWHTTIDSAKLDRQIPDLPPLNDIGNKDFKSYEDWRQHYQQWRQEYEQWHIELDKDPAMAQSFKDSAAGKASALLKDIDRPADDEKLHEEQQKIYKKYEDHSKQADQWRKDQHQWYKKYEAWDNDKRRKDPNWVAPRLDHHEKYATFEQWREHFKHWNHAIRPKDLKDPKGDGDPAGAKNPPDKQGQEPAHTGSKKTDQGSNNDASGFVSIYADMPEKTHGGPKKKLLQEVNFLLENEAVRKQRIWDQTQHILRATNLLTLEPEKYVAGNEAAAIERVVDTKIENMRMRARANNEAKKTKNTESTWSIVGTHRENMIAEVEKLGPVGQKFDIDEYETVRTDFENLQERLEQHGLQQNAITDKHIHTVSDSDFTSTISNLDKRIQQKESSGEKSDDLKHLKAETQTVHKNLTDWKGATNSQIIDRLKPGEQKRQNALKKLQEDNAKIDRDTESTIRGIDAKYIGDKAHPKPKDSKMLNDIQVEESKASKKDYVEGKQANMLKRLEENEDKVRKNADTIIDSISKAFKGLTEGGESPARFPSVAELDRIIKVKLNDRTEPYIFAEHTSSAPKTKKDGSSADGGEDKDKDRIDDAFKKSRAEVERFINDKKLKGPLSSEDEVKVKAAQDLQNRITKIEQLLREREILLKEQRSGKDALWRYGTDHQLHQYRYRARINMVLKDLKDHVQITTEAEVELEQIEKLMKEMVERSRVHKDIYEGTKKDDYLKLETRRAEAVKKLARAKGALEQAKMERERLEIDYKAEEDMYKSDDSKEKEYLARIQQTDDKTLEHGRNLQRDEISARNAMRLEMLKTTNKQLEADQQLMISTRKVLQQLRLQQYHYIMMSCMLTASSTSGVATNQLAAAGMNRMTSFNQLMG